MVSGIILCGLGLGSFAFGFLSLILVNPEGLKPTKQIHGGMVFEDIDIINRVP